MSRNDFYLLVFICFLAVTGYFIFATGAENTGRIVIAGENGEIYSISFEELEKTGRFSKEFTSAAGPIIFTFAPGEGVHVEKALCPDKICLGSPPINKNGQTIACVPGRIYATVKTAAERGEPDAVIR